VAGGLAVVALGSIGALAALALIRESPDWWRTVRRDDPRTIQAAQGIEDRVFNGLYAARPTDPAFVPETQGQWRSEPWTIRVEAADANAWLNVRLPKWLANREEGFRWPDEISEIQVDFDRGALRIGARITMGGQEQVVSATVEPQLNTDGSLSAPATWVHVGRLAVPASWVLEHTEQNAARYMPKSVAKLPETEAMLKAFLGQLPLVRNAVMRLGDGRRVRILSVEAKDGALVLTCQTEVR
jgi:hypothetical protein